MKKTILFLVLCGMLPGFSPAGAGEIRLPVPEIETLPNGLQLAWFVSDSLPVVDLALMVKSGSRDDAPGKSGTTELLSSVLDRGNAGMSAQELAHAVEMLGASRYASADDDNFSIGMHGLAPDAATLLDLLGKMALHPDFPEAEVKREHDRLLDRWSHISDYSESLVSLAYRRELSAGTSYGRGGFLSIREFGAVGRQDVLDYYRKNFTPKNSILMIVGRVNKPEFRKEVLRIFGTPEAWKGEIPARNWRKYADRRVPHKKGAIVIVDRPDLTQAEVRIGFLAPLVQAPEHYSLAVANALLGEYFNSRLNLLIRDKLGLTYGISSAFSYSKDFATFTISSATRNEMVGQLIRHTLEVLKDLKKGPLPAEEVKTAKEYLVGGFPLSTSTLGAVASRWLAGYIYDLGPNYLNEFVPKVSAVTTEQVLAAVAKDFRLDDLVITVAGDAKAITKSLDDAKLRPVLRVEPKQLM
jgi:zinc protease